MYQMLAKRLFVICKSNVNLICKSNVNLICKSNVNFICKSNMNFICKSNVTFICKSNVTFICKSNVNFILTLCWVIFSAYHTPYIIIIICTILYIFVIAFLLTPRFGDRCGE